jgi:hypothetical protein
VNIIGTKWVFKNK